MRRPEGLRFGRYSVLGGVDLSAFLSRQQVREVAHRHPEFLQLASSRPTAGLDVQPAARGDAPVPLAAEPSRPPEPARPRRVLPVLDERTGLRDCRTCPAPCCMMLAAALTPDEAASGQYEKVGPDQQGLYFMPRPYGRCTYLTVDNSCSIYDRRPDVCRTYRCDLPGREDERIARWFLQREAATEAA
jgi:Fe-S-cluster containining protein